MDDLAAFSGTAAAWVEHLRAGGTTPWRAWVSGHAPSTDAGGRSTLRLPGASQLELLRRLNLAEPTRAGAVADRLLARSGPGRGPTELPLLWPARPELTSGGQVTTPVDPGTLPAGELLRVGAGLLADLVRDLPLPEPGAPAPDPAPVPGARRRGPSFVLDGPPRTVAGLRAALAAEGLHEHRPRLSWLGGRRPPSSPDLVIVPVLPLEDLLGEVWEERARRGSPRGWRRFVRGLEGRRTLPPGADPVATAARWARQVGAERVHLLTPDRLGDGLSRLLGVGAPSAPAGHRLAPVLVDVLRRHHAVQALHLPVAERQPRTDLLVGVLEGMEGDGPAALAVPAGCRGWVTETGAAMAAACGGYAGAGDPAVLTRNLHRPAPPARPSHRRAGHDRGDPAGRAPSAGGTTVSGDPSTRTRVVLHVGAPKTGTSYVQDVLFGNRAELGRARGALPGRPVRRTLPGCPRPDGAALGRVGGAGGRSVGPARRAQVRDWSGTVIVSHEILATASRAQVRRALDSFGDAEVHVVMSVRDLVRQIPAEWQENVKHRRVITYRDFLGAITAPTPTREIATWFWGVQDVPAVLDRWAADLPPERVHLITVPKPGAPASQLWERFAAVFGFPPDAIDTSRAERTNPSMGVAETALVRAVNHRVNNGVLPNVHYREFVRELLAHRTLSRREHMERPGAPARRAALGGRPVRAVDRRAGRARLPGRGLAGGAAPGTDRVFAVRRPRRGRTGAAAGPRDDRSGDAAAAGR